MEYIRRETKKVYRTPVEGNNPKFIELQTIGVQWFSLDMPRFRIHFPEVGFPTRKKKQKENESCEVSDGDCVSGCFSIQKNVYIVGRVCRREMRIWLELRKTSFFITQIHNTEQTSKDSNLATVLYPSLLWQCLQKKWYFTVNYLVNNYLCFEDTCDRVAKKWQA